MGEVPGAQPGSDTGVVDRGVKLHQGVKVKVMEHVLPDVNACHIWLRNRKCEDWNAATKHDNTNSNTTNAIVDVTHVSLDDRIMQLLDGSFRENMEALLL